MITLKMDALLVLLQEYISSISVVSFCDAFLPFLPWYQECETLCLSFVTFNLILVILMMTPMANYQPIANMLKKIKNY